MKSTIALCSAALLLASCTKRIDEGFAGAGEPVRVEIGFAVEEAASASDGGGKTKIYENGAVEVVFSEVAETEQTKASLELKNVWTIQFDAEGRFVTADKTPILRAGENLTPTLRAGKGQKLYVVAAMDDQTDFSTALEGKSLADFRKLAGTLGASPDMATAAGIPMCSDEVSADIYSNGKFLGDKIFKLKRIAAQILFTARIDEAAGGDYAITSVRLVNKPKNFYFAVPDGATYPEAEAGNFEDAAATGDAEAQQSWFVPDNVRGTIANDDPLKKVPGSLGDYCTYAEVQVLDRQESRLATLKIYLGADMVGDFNIRRNKIYTVTCTVHNFSASGDQRVTIAEDVDVVEANCGMVTPGGAAMFSVEDRQKKLTGAEASGLPLKQWTKGAGYVPVVIWQDVQGLVQSIGYDKEQGYVTVMTDQDKGAGNVVVGLYPAGTTTSNYTDKGCLWSWHVWVTDYRPDGTKDYGLGENSYAAVDGGQVHTYGTKFMAAVKAVKPTRNRVIMDRNLGATKTYYTAPASGDNTADQAFGLFYQWGRKDPFPRAQGSTIDANTGRSTMIPIYGPDGKTVLSEDGTGYKKVDITTGGVISENNSLAYAVAHPLSFLYQAVEFPDWYAPNREHRNNALWGDGTAKSVYDPCPEGWRIAPVDTWSDFTRTTDNAQPLNGTFPFYIQGKPKEDGKEGDYFPTNGRYYTPLGGAEGVDNGVRVWYPTPGCITDKNGIVVHGGLSGYSQSSHVYNEERCHFLAYNIGAVLNSHSDSRAFGVQVRCLQE